MNLDGDLAQIQLSGDLLVHQAGHDIPHHFLLTRRQPAEPVARPPGAHELVDDARIDGRAAGRDAPCRIGQLGRLAEPVLEHVPDTTGPGTEQPEPKEPTLTLSHLDLGMVDRQLLIAIRLNWTDTVYRTTVAPRMYGVANQIKGKMAIFSSEYSWHAIAAAGPKYLAAHKTFPRGTAERGSNHERLGLPYPPTQRVSFFRELLPFFNALECDHLILEFARRGYEELDVFRDLKPGLALGIGVVDIKDNEVESPDLIARRLDNAVKVLGAERIRWVHPDCGFWMLQRSIADRKMEALVRGRDRYLGG